MEVSALMCHHLQQLLLKVHHHHPHLSCRLALFHNFGAEEIMVSNRIGFSMVKSDRHKLSSSVIRCCSVITDGAT